MAQLSKEFGTAVIIITHNLGVVARYAQRVNVMYAGKIVEASTSREVYGNPRHPYTIGLLKSVPRLDQVQEGQAGPDRWFPSRPDKHAARAAASIPAVSIAVDRCQEEEPPLMLAGEKHYSACWVMPTHWKGPERMRSESSAATSTETQHRSATASSSR